MSDSTWTWVSGSNNSDNLHGVYGDQGVPDINNVPGARSGANGWCDGITKEFWIFGGHGYDFAEDTAPYNDLWRFNMNDSTWTWISGSDAPTHRGYGDQQGETSSDFMPSARERAVGGFDNNTREFWLFSGETSFGMRFVVFYAQPNTSLKFVMR